MNKYKVIDMTKWKRAMHCEIFHHCAQPQYCISFELNITNFLEMVRRKHISFTFAFIYAVAKCANEIEEYRYRFEDGKVVLYDEINTSFTYINDELYKVINVPMRNSIEEYVTLAKEIADKQTAYFAGPLENNVYIFSSLPWVSFTHISHTDSGKKENAAPLFDWGKYYDKDGAIMLPFAVQVHHSFVDGIHIGKLAEKLQKYLDSFAEK